MLRNRRVTRICCAVVLAVGVAACGGGSGSGPRTSAEEEATQGTLGLAAALEAARATGGDGSFDHASYMVAQSVTATHDGMAATIAVTETGTPQGGSARAGELVAADEGRRPIAGWHGARFVRGDGMETLVAYSLGGISRRDLTRHLRLDLYNRGITVSGFSPQVSVVQERRTSNARLYDYERMSGELRFVRQF